jgi:hypothetical protein
MMEKLCQRWLNIFSKEAITILKLNAPKVMVLTIVIRISNIFKRKRFKRAFRLKRIPSARSKTIV